MQFTLLIFYVNCALSFISLFFRFLFFFLSFVSSLRFCGYIFCKPSQDLTHPLGGTKRFKGLIACAKCNRDSYESELDFRVLFFVLLEDKQKLGVGVFVSMIYDIILCPYLPSFWFI